jgi:cell wall-associated NlpC family hydrolase
VIEAPALIENARSWAGVRFLHQGRSRHGADCLGYIAAMLSELGSDTFLQELPHNYARSPQSLLIEGLTRLCRQIPLQPAALILFQWPHTPDASHAAVYTGTTMIHAYQSLGKVVEHGFRGPWAKRAVSYWAMPEVIYL